MASILRLCNPARAENFKPLHESTGYLLFLLLRICNQEAWSAKLSNKMFCPLSGEFRRSRSSDFQISVGTPVSVLVCKICFPGRRETLIYCSSVVTRLRRNTTDKWIRHDYLTAERNFCRNPPDFKSSQTTFLTYSGATYFFSKS